ncbi:ribosomal protein S6 kinase alpha-2 [Verticillium dahliae VdLs.17]|uniref:Ribosomal protein S6 kinase alpha-2 n=2 Tax=Verticillium dahliae TaxID=27337 RepID=G2XAQ6_VERDV|nr:ribosomal protein S6 kinase alpha-2 [Verticillium dahliae VdLs.17]EGY16223.1 ribosomal protein S6 kinase alpha-2 [Verticillium dahliae VdLs.17]KAH6702696.1 ribosomal protein S6 kinase alpha-2 [Verticillium dahliae]
MSVVSRPSILEVSRRVEERERNAPVPCQWPDNPTSAHAADANDPAQPLTVSADQVEYGILCVKLWKIRSNVPGQWKPRAILEHGSSLIELDLSKWLISGSVARGHATTLRIDLSLMAQPCEAILHLLFERHLDSNQSPRGGDAVLDLGSISLGPFAEPRTMRMESCFFKDAAVEIDITVTFSRAHLPIMLEDRMLSKWRRGPRRDLGDLQLIEAKDTDTFYLMTTISAEDYRKGSATFSHESPWILPVRFSYKSPGHLHFLSPISSNKHLLGLVQKCRRVTNGKAQLYAAQLVCALESLHDLGVVGLLSSENVLVDVFGDIRIITPRLFTTDQSFSQTVYTAPEVLRGEEPSQLTDWWMMGALLYEILTGLPPFYHEVHAERDRKTLAEELDVPTYVQGATADILRRLLDRNPAQRLGGVCGVSEIKKHDFFVGLDWQHPSAGRSELTPSQPHNADNIFKNSLNNVTIKPPRKPRESGGYVYEEYPYGQLANGGKPEQTIGRLRSSSDIFNPALSERVHLSPDQAAANALQADPGREGGEPEAIMARLKAALQTKQSTEKVAHILDGCASDVLATVLMSPILLVNMTPIDTIAPMTLSCEVPITALEWTVELGRADLVLLLLGWGADSNFTFDERYGPALTRAARERRTQLVDILAPKTSRILALRTLCLAVEQRDIPTVTCLLSHGVPCDFDAADHPLPSPRTSHHETGFCGTEPSMIWGFYLPPVIRAARHGDAAMVRLLLSHGADPNTAYHSMTWLAPEWHDSWQEAAEARGSWNAGFVCGRVVQLAMQLEHRDVVDALLEGGADIGLPHSEWPGPAHFCSTVPRSVYLRVTAGLEEAARVRGG